MEWGGLGWGLVSGAGQGKVHIAAPVCKSYSFKQASMHRPSSWDVISMALRQSVSEGKYYMW